MRSRPSPRVRPARRGAILLVVLALLALFAVIGLSFALYAESAATSARIGREAKNRADANAPGNLAFDGQPLPADEFINLALGQLLFGPPDTDKDPGTAGAVVLPTAASAFRGYSLLDMKYGFDRANKNGNLSPFAGQGLMSDTDEGGGGGFTSTAPALAGVKRSGVVNYAYQPGSNFVLDINRTKFRTDPAQAAASGSTYFNVAAPYTYPDLKDLYLAVMSTQDDTTNTPPNHKVGRILQPSFHRFGPTGMVDPTTGPLWVFNKSETNPLMRLAPTSVKSGNLDWTSADGRLRILRPRPEDHKISGASEFPDVPPNVDGTYTGDVQNLPNPGGVQRNDSLWMYLGGPVRSYNGKKYTALVAPLVLDLGGRVNLTTAGNGKGTSGDVASSMGVGRWEVNPRWVFDPAAATRPTATPNELSPLLSGGNFVGATGSQMVNGRYGPSGVSDPVTGLAYARFNGNLTNSGTPTANLRVPPFYSRIDFDALGSGSGDLVTPIGSGHSPFPTFATSRYYDDSTKSTELANSSAQYSPEFFTDTGAAGRTFPAADMRWLLALGGKSDDSARADTAKLLPKQLISKNYDSTKAPSSPTQFTSTGVNGTTNPTPYGVVDPVQDPAVLTRLLVTTLSNSTNRPELVVPTTTGGTARLGPVDLARTLPDYRIGSGLASPPTPDTVNVVGAATDPPYSNVLAAQAARQRFARDILVRLAAVAGLVDSTTPYVNDPAAADYGALRVPYSLHGDIMVGGPRLVALRQLAQVAVNIVDYVDSDDVSTPFVWAQTKTGDAPFDPAATFNVGGGLGIAAGEEVNHVVMGTELPRLVVNEAYACLRNKTGGSLTEPLPTDPTNKTGAKDTEPFETQFWVELHNPFGTTTTPTDTALSDNGDARLLYKKGATGSPGAADQTVEFSPYQVLVVDAGGVANMTNADNILGDPGTPLLRIGRTAADVATELKFDDSGGKSSKLTGDDMYVVKPAAGAATGPDGENKGYFVLGPKDDYPETDITATLRLKDPAMGGGPQPAMKVLAGDAKKTTMDTEAAKKYAVVIRRLANPYLPEQSAPDKALYNPYVTVDFHKEVTVSNRVTNTSDEGKRAEDPDKAPSKGRKHPYAASNTVPDNVTDQDGGADPKNTFFKANTMAATPFRWLQHLDRQPLNPLELASVSAMTPAALTTQFLTTQGADPVYNTHTVERALLAGLKYNKNGGTRSFTGVTTEGALHQAFGMLAARSPVSQSAVGAPDAGRVNLNGITHPSVLRAVLDRNDANTFTQANVDGMWTNLTGALTGARSPGYPDLSFSSAPGLDNPIWGFTGTPGAAVEKSVLRVGTEGLPIFFATPATSDPSPAELHNSFLSEPLRKMWNNTTPTSDTFLVVMTVGFFEVRQEATTTTPIVLGKEMVIETPGDTRQKYVAVLDRSHAALDLDATQAVAAGTNPTGKQAKPGTDPWAPWYTVTETDVIAQAYPVTPPAAEPSVDVQGKLSGANVVVFGNGQPVTLKPDSDVFRLGFGDTALNNGEGEAFKFTVAADAKDAAGVTIPGQVRLTLKPANPATTVIRYHPAGSVVTNVLLGHPGPQTGFDPIDPRYKPLVPYFSRIPKP